MIRVLLSCAGLLASVPACAQDGRADVVAEGDSLSVHWSGGYTGLYAESRPDLKVVGLAVGGSTISKTEKRLPAVLAARPKVFTLFLGANDLPDTKGTFNAAAWVDRLTAYTDQVRATGAKVVVIVPVPQCGTANPINASANVSRAKVLPLLIGSVGTHFDALVRTDLDPAFDTPEDGCNKEVFQPDGVHLSVHGLTGGQGRLFLLYKPVVDALLAGKPVPKPK